MIPVINPQIEKLLVDAENTHITLSEDSWALNFSGPVTPIKRNTQTVAEMKSGKFRRLFNRHSVAYRFFN
jgi:hypothetical protein